MWDDLDVLVEELVREGVPLSTELPLPVQIVHLTRGALGAEARKPVGSAFSAARALPFFPLFSET